MEWFKLVDHWPSGLTTGQFEGKINKSNTHIRIPRTKIEAEDEFEQKQTWNDFKLNGETCDEFFYKRRDNCDMQMLIKNDCGSEMCAHIPVKHNISLFWLCGWQAPEWSGADPGFSFGGGGGGAQKISAHAHEREARGPLRPAPPPPPPLECMKGAAFAFFGKGGYFLAVVSGRFPEKTRKRGRFCNCQWKPIPDIGGISFSRDREYIFPRDWGVQVMENEHRYPLVLWEWGGGGAGLTTGIQRPLIRGLEALGVFDALSCYLSITFKHSYTK